MKISLNSTISYCKMQRDIAYGKRYAYLDHPILNHRKIKQAEAEIQLWTDWMNYFESKRGK